LDENHIYCNIHVKPAENTLAHTQRCFLDFLKRIQKDGHKVFGVDDVINVALDNVNINYMHRKRVVVNS